jgi:hypothetical protein
MSLAKTLVRPLIPQTLRSGGLVRSAYKLCHGLLYQYGWVRAFRAGQCIDAAGDPVPWFTYPAIDYLSQLDYTGRSVFEWGCGNSTLFWAARGVARAVGVEYDPKWYERVKSLVPANCTILFTPRDLDEYPAAIRGRGPFDIIVVDGSAESRLLCSREAVEYLTETGMIILDNSDLCPKSSEFLRSTGLIQVDFTGFGPSNTWAGTTTLFLTRQFNFRPTGEQPRRSVAQPLAPWPGV